MSAILIDLRWRWARVGGSQVAHLVPSTVLPLSRSACSRVAVYDAVVELPSGLLDEVPLCLACKAYGQRGGLA